MAAMDDLVILFEAEVSVVRRDTPNDVLAGEVVVAYHPATQQHKAAVYVPDEDGDTVTHICTLKNYQYEVELPLTARRVASTTYFDLKVDSGKALSLHFKYDYMGVAFASYIIGIMWFVGERSAPVVLVVKEGNTDAAPVEQGQRVKLTTMGWEIACLNSYDEKAFKIADITDPDKRKPTKRYITVGAKEAPLLEHAVAGRRKKDKLLVAGEGMIMYVDVGSVQQQQQQQQLASPQPATPSHTALMVDALRESNASMISASFAAMQPHFGMMPSPAATARSGPSVKATPGGAGGPHTTPPRQRHQRMFSPDSKSRGMGRSGKSAATSSACSDSVVSHDLENPRITLSGVPAFELSAGGKPGTIETRPLLLDDRDDAPPPYPIDMHSGDTVVMDDLFRTHRPPGHALLLLQHWLSNDYFMMLRLAAYPAVLIAWIAVAKPTLLSTPYASLPLGVGAALGAVCDALHLANRKDFNRTLAATISYRNHMLRTFGDTDQDLMSYRCAGSGALLLALAVAAIVTSVVVEAQQASPRDHLGQAVLLPLVTLSAVAVLLRFAVVSSVLLGIMNDAVPELARTAGGRRDFALGHQKWLRSLVTTWGAVRQVLHHSANEWCATLFAVAATVLYAGAWAAWGSGLRRDDVGRCCVSACVFAVIGITAHLLDNWHYVNRHAASVFLQHYEWRQSEEAAKVLRVQALTAEAPLWHTALSYFQASLAVPAVWRIGPFQFADGIFKTVMTLSAAASIYFIVNAVVQSTRD